jgi:enediyne biosynthesis protein E4
VSRLLPSTVWQPSIFRRRRPNLELILVAVLAGGCGTDAPVAPSKDAAAAGAPVVSTVAVPADASSSHVELVEVAARSGVEFTFRSGADAAKFTVLEGNGGGVAVFDLDGDHLLDLYFPGGGAFPQRGGITGAPPGLFRNICPWQFQNVLEQARVGTTSFYSQGCAAGDFDNDGFTDLAVYGFRGIQVLRNQGDGTFLDVTGQSGVREELWANAAGWGDLDGDGNLDLYVAHYIDWSLENNPECLDFAGKRRDICGPRRFHPQPDQLYFSDGAGMFQERSREAGLRADGFGLGVVLADVDDDADVDVYVGNDSGPNFLYINQGRGHLVEQGEQLGVARDDFGIPNGSMGVDLFDFNRDQLGDLVVANFELESLALYNNQGAAGFVHVSRIAGLTAWGDMFVGWGIAGLDLDRDGDEDLLVANGHVFHFPRSGERAQHTLVLRNEYPRQRFTRLTYPPDTYLGRPHDARGLAYGDLDMDGDLDAVISHVDKPAALLDNRTVNSNQSVSIRLVGRHCNRDCIGARAVLHTSSGDLVRCVKGGGSYCSQSDLRLSWGIPHGATITAITVHWPGGIRQDVRAAPGAESLTIIEPMEGSDAYQNTDDAPIDL